MNGAAIVVTGVAGLVLGGVLGSVSTRMLYGPSPDRLQPAPPRTIECPPCPTCPVCPEPLPCPEVAGLPVPTLPSSDPADESPDSAESADSAESDSFGSEPPPPGLPLAAVSAAEAAVRQALTACAEGRGIGLLELRVAATGTTGRVLEVELTRSRIEPLEQEECVLEQVRRVRFPHQGPDGESRIKLPVRLGD